MYRTDDLRIFVTVFALLADDNESLFHTYAINLTFSCPRSFLVTQIHTYYCFHRLSVLVFLKESVCNRYFTQTEVN